MVPTVIARPTAGCKGRIRASAAAVPILLAGPRTAEYDRAGSRGFPVRRIRVYVDTSVFGGIGDEEFAEASERFFESVRSGKFAILLSNETVRELLKAPVSVQRIWRSFPPESVERVNVDDEATALAEAYIAAGVLGRSSETDALHVAAATVAGADLILSWNFRHIVNYDRILGFNGVNVRNGYRSMVILSPQEVGHED